MKTTTSTYNLTSPNQIHEPCDLEHLDDWFQKEAEAVDDDAIREVVCHLASNLGSFVRFPQRALLLWDGCDRVKPEGKRQKVHKYPVPIKDKAKGIGLSLDTRPNGPAIASFIFAGGKRPERYGSKNAWSIHHLYSGKFPHVTRSASLHGQKDGRHFTQSAGLVAVHPLADALSDELPAFSWLLRANAFQHFGYDPDHVFCKHPVDNFGFAAGFSTEVIYDGTKTED